MHKVLVSVLGGVREVRKGRVLSGLGFFLPQFTNNSVGRFREVLTTSNSEHRRISQLRTSERQRRICDRKHGSGLQHSATFGLGTVCQVVSDFHYSIRQGLQHSATFGPGTVCQVVSDFHYSIRQGLQHSATFGPGTVCQVVSDFHYNIRQPGEEGGAK